MFPLFSILSMLVLFWLDVLYCRWIGLGNPPTGDAILIIGLWLCLFVLGSRLKLWDLTCDLASRILDWFIVAFRDRNQPSDHSLDVMLERWGRVRNNLSAERWQAEDRISMVSAEAPITVRDGVGIGGDPTASAAMTSRRLQEARTIELNRPMEDVMEDVLTILDNIPAATPTRQAKAKRKVAKRKTVKRKPRIPVAGRNIGFRKVYGKEVSVTEPPPPPKCDINEFEEI